jgi:hypothetical protein
VEERALEFTAEPKSTDTLTAREAFDAMRLFLEAIWQREGRPSDEIAFLIGGSRWVDGSPIDVTMWEDWLRAVRICSSAEKSAGEAT